MNEGNILVCPTCRARMIAEDELNHVCDEGYRIEGNILWTRTIDGTWRSRVIADESLQKKRRRGLDSSG